MNLLLEPLPTAVRVGGIEYEIESDFRFWVRFGIQIFNGELSDINALAEFLASLFSLQIPGDIQGAIEAMLWFYRCGKPLPESTEESGGRTEPVFSFEHDDSYIYAAFLSQYGIDLNSIPYLHWWKFKAMFESLKNDNKIVEIMGYRGMKLPASMGKESREMYTRLKHIYALPQPKEEKELNDAIMKALQNGGDLTGLV